MLTPDGHDPYAGQMENYVFFVLHYSRRNTAFTLYLHPRVSKLWSYMQLGIENIRFLLITKDEGAGGCETCGQSPAPSPAQRRANSATLLQGRAWGRSGCDRS